MSLCSNRLRFFFLQGLRADPVGTEAKPLRTYPGPKLRDTEFSADTSPDVPHAFLRPADPLLGSILTRIPKFGIQ